MEAEEDLTIVYDRARRLLVTNLSGSSYVDDLDHAQNVYAPDSRDRSVSPSEYVGSPLSQASQYSAPSQKLLTYPSAPTSHRSQPQASPRPQYPPTMLESKLMAQDAKSDGRRDGPDYPAMFSDRTMTDRSMRRAQDEDSERRSSVAYARSNASYEMGKAETLLALTDTRESSTPRTDSSHFAQSLKCADRLVTKVTGMLEQHRPTAPAGKSAAALHGEMFEFLSELAVDVLALRWRVVADVRAVEATDGSLRQSPLAKPPPPPSEPPPPAPPPLFAPPAAIVDAPARSSATAEAPRGPKLAAAQRAEGGPAAQERRQRELAKQVLQLQVRSETALSLSLSL
jgi:hypothetical protein